MDEDAALDTRKLRQLVVPNSTPLLRKCLPALKALRRDRDSLDAPVAPRLVRVEDIERLLGLGDPQGRLKLEQVLLQQRSSVIADGERGEIYDTFQGANCSNRRILPCWSTRLRFSRASTTKSRAGSHALA